MKHNYSSHTHTNRMTDLEQGQVEGGEGGDFEVEHFRGFDMDIVSKLRDPYMAALNGDWDTLKNFFTEENCQLLFASMTIDSDTALHIAAYSGKKYVLQHLVDLLPPHRVHEALSKKNDHGNNTFHEVATTDKVEAAEFLVRKLNAAEVKEILNDKNDLGETPVYRAVAYGHTKMAKFLLDECVADKSSAKEKTNVADISLHFQRNDSVSILHIAVIGQHFGLSLIHIIPVTFKIRTF